MQTLLILHKCNYIRQLKKIIFGHSYPYSTTRRKEIRLAPKQSINKTEKRNKSH